MTISTTTRVVAAKGQVFCDLGGEAAILSLASGIYFGLNPIGAFIWNRIQAAARVDEVCDAVIEQYEVDRERCLSDVKSLFQELFDQNLIEVIDDPPGSAT